MNSLSAPSSLKSMSGLSGVITACHLKKLLLPLLAGSSHFTFKFYCTWRISFLIHSQPACQKHNPFFMNLHGVWETPLSFDPGGGIWLQLCPVNERSWYSWVIGFPAAPAGQFVVTVLSRQLLWDVVDAAEKAPNMASAALTNSSRRLLCLCGLSRWPC